jgi:hypothetical protein
MLIIPLQSVSNQSVNVGLANQLCQLNIYQKSTGLFFDLLVSSAPIVSGVICLNLVKLVRRLYLGFIGDFVFFDSQGNTDPVSTGLGSRYLLAYLSPSDLGQVVAATPQPSGSVPSPGPSPSIAQPLFVKSGGRFTLTPNVTQTTVPDTACLFTSFVNFNPLTADAANDMATTSYIAQNGQFLVNHASNARTDRTFSYEIFGT